MLIVIYYGILGISFFCSCLNVKKCFDPLFDEILGTLLTTTLQIQYSR